jgi:hypothetical protein
LPAQPHPGLPGPTGGTIGPTRPSLSPHDDPDLVRVPRAVAGLDTMSAARQRPHHGIVSICRSHKAPVDPPRHPPGATGKRGTERERLELGPERRVDQVDGTRRRVHNGDRTRLLLVAGRRARRRRALPFRRALGRRARPQPASVSSVRVVMLGSFHVALHAEANT